MTFLCTVDGELVAGERGGVPRTHLHDGLAFYDWPKPWALRCDECGRVFEYGCVQTLKSKTTLRPPTVRHVGVDAHRCAYCEGFVEPDVQLALEVAA